MSAATTVNIYAEAVLRTGTMPASLNGAPNLGQHQATSKAVAQEWINTVRVGIYQSNADLAAYSVKFQNFYHILYNLAGNLTPQNKVQFTKGLTLLQTQLKANLQQSQDALTRLQAFNTKLEGSVSNMTTDFKNINATYAGDHGQLQQMQDQLNSAKKAISTDTEIIALSRWEQQGPS